MDITCIGIDICHRMNCYVDPNAIHIAALTGRGFNCRQLWPNTKTSEQTAATRLHCPNVPVAIQSITKKMINIWSQKNFLHVKLKLQTSSIMTSVTEIIFFSSVHNPFVWLVCLLLPGLYWIIFNKIEWPFLTIKLHCGQFSAELLYILYNPDLLALRLFWKWVVFFLGVLHEATITNVWLSHYYRCSVSYQQCHKLLQLLLRLK